MEPVRGLVRENNNQFNMIQDLSYGGSSASDLDHWFREHPAQNSSMISGAARGILGSLIPVAGAAVVRHLINNWKSKSKGREMKKSDARAMVDNILSQQNKLKDMQLADENRRIMGEEINEDNKEFLRNLLK